MTEAEKEIDAVLREGGLVQFYEGDGINFSDCWLLLEQRRDELREPTGSFSVRRALRASTVDRIMPRLAVASLPTNRFGVTTYRLRDGA